MDFRMTDSALNTASEIIIFSAVAYGLEIAWSYCQQPYITTRDMIETDATDIRAKGTPCLARQRAQLVQTQPHCSTTIIYPGWEL